MPELPEVETVCRGLTPVMVGREIATLTLNRPDLRFPFPADFKTRIQGQTITALSRRAKFLRAELSSGDLLVMHLGMSGRFTIDHNYVPGQFTQAHATNPKHDHVEFVMRGGAAAESRIVFNDPRRFGFMELYAPGQPTRYDALGPEPLSNLFSPGALSQKLSGKAAPIKSALLDQSVVAGLGNIYVCEALYMCGVSPLRLSRDVSPSEIAALVPAIQTTLRAAIEAGGSSLRDFANTDGDLGYFQHSFKVYGRSDDPCPAPNCDATIARIKQSGRSSFYCPNCQV